MEFTLHYRGYLRSNGDASDKHALRKCFHGQLKELWKHPPLDLVYRKAVDKPRPPDTKPLKHSIGPLILVPLVTSGLGLYAKLEITMLRPQAPGNLIAEGGDIDNRLKTLLDALRIPKTVAEIPIGVVPTADESPFFCLLEDDGLISGISVSTDRLLEPDVSKSETVLFIRVITKKYTSTWSNIDL